MRRIVLVLLVAATLAAWAAAAASADSAPIPPNSASPGSDPGHSTPLEVLAGSIASHIAGRQVAVHCESQDDWNVLATQFGFDPKTELGFVSAFYSPITLTFVTAATLAHLSPAVCLPLEQFAEAATKPTKCQATTSTQTDVTRYQTVTRYRTVGKGGKRRRVKYTAQEPYTAVVTTTALGPPAPCFVGAVLPSASSGASACWTGVCYSATANESSDYWATYDAYAQAILTLAHEPIHLWQDQAGARVPDDALVEAQAECSGMQWAPYVAEALGDSADDAQAIATYSWTIDYPGYRAVDQQDAYASAHPYWSADCAPGGALDIRPPGSTLWP